MTEDRDTLALLEAKHEIEQALLRYTRGVDRKDWELVRSAYRADATDVHGDFTGDVDGLINWLMQRHEDIEQSLHAVCNISYDWVSEGEAVVESYYIVYQRLKSAEKVESSFQPASTGSDQTLQLTAVGRYIDRFLREDGRWLIADRQVLFDLLKAEPTPLGGGLPASILQSRRDAEDVLWRELNKQ